MKVHRARSIEPQRDGDIPYYFIELEPETWMEVPDLEFDHADIHKFLDSDEKNRVRPMRYASSAFRMGIIPDWQEVASVR